MRVEDFIQGDSVPLHRFDLSQTLPPSVLCTHYSRTANANISALYPIIEGGLGVPEANPNNGDSEQHRSQDRDKRLQNPCVSCRGGQGGLCFGAKHVTVATAEQVDPSPLQMPQLSRYPLS